MCNSMLSQVRKKILHRKFCSNGTVGIQDIPVNSVTSLPGGASRKSNETVSRWIGTGTGAVLRRRNMTHDLPFRVFSEGEVGLARAVDLSPAEASPRARLDLHSLHPSLLSREKKENGKKEEERSIL